MVSVTAIAPVRNVSVHERRHVVRILDDGLDLISHETVRFGAGILLDLGLQLDHGALHEELIALLVGLVPDHHLGRAGEVFEEEHGEGFALALGVFDRDFADHAGETLGLFPGLHLGQVGEGGELALLDDAPVFVERVTGDVEAEEVLLVGEVFALVPDDAILLDHLRRSSGGHELVHVEERGLPGGAVALGCARSGDDLPDAREHVVAPLHREVEGAGLDEVLEDLAVDGAPVEASREILERSEFAFRLALADDGLHRAFADVLDRGETVADRVTFGDELEHGPVHIGREDGDAHALAFGDKGGDLVGVVDFVRQDRGHELDRVVRLEVGGVIADEPVGGGVRLVEAVSREFFEKVEDVVGLFLGDVVHRLAARDEGVPLLDHLREILFPHGPPEKVGLAEGVAGEEVRGALDLLLVDEDAVGLLARLFEERVEVLDLFLALLPLDEIGNELHRTRTIEGDERDDVLDPVHVELAAEAHHSAGFELEHSSRLAAVEELESGLVVEALVVEDETGRVPLDQVDGVLHHREGLQAEEVHLQHAQVGERAHRILGHDFPFLAADEGDVVRQLAVADDDPGRVDAGAAGEALEEGRVFPQLADRGIVRDLGGELGILLLRVDEGDVQLRRDHLRDAVAFGETQPHDAPDVTHDALRAEGAEGDDVRDGALAVFPPHVFDHLGTPRLAEVDVDIGRRDPLGIEEPLENEAEAQRTEIGDAEHIGDERSRRRSPARTNRDAVVLRPLHEIPGDEEVGDEAHLRHDADLVVETGAQLFIPPRALAVAPGEALVADLAEVLLAQAAIGRLKLRVFLRTGRVEVDRDIAHVRDAQGVVAGLGQILEETPHFIGRLEIDLGGILHPVLVHEERAGPDADHHVVRVVVGLVEKVDVVRGNEAETILFSKLHHLPRAGGLLGEAVVVHLEEKTVLPEDVDEFTKALARRIEVLVLDELVHLAVDAAAQADEPFGMGGEGLLVDPRFVIHPLEVAEADELHQVRVTFVGRGEQGDVRIALFLLLPADGDGVGLLVGQGDTGRGEVGLAADDGFDPRLLRLLIKLDRPEDVAVIGHRHRRHLAALDLLHQIRDAHRPVEEGILGVQVEVDEGIGRHWWDGKGRSLA